MCFCWRPFMFFHSMVSGEEIIHRLTFGINKQHKTTNLASEWSRASIYSIYYTVPVSLYNDRCYLCGMPFSLHLCMTHCNSLRCLQEALLHLCRMAVRNATSPCSSTLKLNISDINITTMHSILELNGVLYLYYHTNWVIYIIYL